MRHDASRTVGEIQVAARICGEKVVRETHLVYPEARIGHVDGLAKASKSLSLAPEARQRLSTHTTAVLMLFFNCMVTFLHGHGAAAQYGRHHFHLCVSVVGARHQRHGLEQHLEQCSHLLGGPVLYHSLESFASEAEEEHVLASLGRQVYVPEAVRLSGGQLVHLHELMLVVSGAKLLNNGIELQAIPQPENTQSLGVNAQMLPASRIC